MPYPEGDPETTEEVFMDASLSRDQMFGDAPMPNLDYMYNGVVEEPNVAEREEEGQPRRRLEDVPVRPFGQPRPNFQNTTTNMNKVFRFTNIHRDIDGYGHRVVEIGRPTEVHADVQFIANQIRNTEPVVFRLTNYEQPELVEETSKNDDPPKDAAPKPELVKKEEEKKKVEEGDEPAAKKSMSRFEFEQKELAGKMINGIVGGMAKKTNENLWSIVVEGPEDSVYEGSRFFGHLALGPKYPEVAPSIRFNSIIFHPNVNEEGYLDCRPLAAKWKSHMGIRECYDFIIDQLANVMTNEALPQPLNPKLAQLLATNPTEFENCARQTCSMYTEC